MPTTVSLYMEKKFFAMQSRLLISYLEIGRLFELSYSNQVSPFTVESFIQLIAEDIARDSKGDRD